MKINRDSLRCSSLILTFVALVASHAPAQSPNNPAASVVRIETTQPVAEESSNPFRRLALRGRFTISRTGPTNSSLSAFVLYSGSARAGHDYEALPWLVTIPAGATSIALDVVALPDDLAEPIEIVEAELSECPPLTNPPLGIPCWQLNIDPAHASARVFIRDDGITTASLEITSPRGGARFSSGATIPIDATAIDIDGAITEVGFYDGDTRIGESRINFFQQPPPGTPIQHHFDWNGAGQGAHALSARARNAAGEVVLSPRVSIVVGAEQPVVSIEATVPETSEPSPNVRVAPGVFTLRRSGETNRALRVLVAYRGTATAGVDYQALPTTVVIPAGVKSVELLVGPLDDSLVEGDESVIAELSAPVVAMAPDYRIDPNHEQARVVIHDNDFSTVPVVRIKATMPETSEPSPLVRFAPGRFTLRRTGGTASGLWVFVAYRGTARAGTDYDSLPTSVQIPAGATSIDLSVVALQDNLVEGDETVVAQVQPDLTMGPIEHYRVEPTQHVARVVIHDQTTPASPVVVRIVATDTVAREGTNSAGQINTASFEIRRTGVADNPLTVFFEVGGRAENGVDYQELRSPVVIPAGQRSMTLKVVPIDDRDAEHAESVVVKLIPSPVLSPLPGYTVGKPARAAVVILDNDRPRPHCARLADGLFNLCLPVGATGCFRIEGSDDLVQWDSVGTLEARDGAVDFIDPDGPDHGRRFYRAVPVDCDP